MYYHRSSTYKLNCIWFLECEFTWSDNKVRELVQVKELHTSLRNIGVVAFKVLPWEAMHRCRSPPFKTILELILRNGLQSCSRITPDVINVIKMPPFQYFLYLREQKKLDPRPRKPKLMAVGIRCADHATPSIR
jgi:hypothetical protein